MMIGQRVRLSREACGFTQSDLAKAVGVSQAALSQIESGRTDQPTEETLEAIAEATGFPYSFFERGPLPELPQGKYRKLKRCSSKIRKQIEAHAQLIVDVVQDAETRLPLPPVTIEPVTEVTDIGMVETLALRCRRLLGINPFDPIPNLMRSVERAGVVVGRLPWEMDDHNGYSVWPDYGFPSSGRPVILLSEGKPGDRDRFNVAHELGHLLLHTLRPQVHDAQAEIEAHRFAGALLLPKAQLEEWLEAPIVLDDLKRVKARFGISMQATAKRASELGIISERQHTAIWKQIQIRGWREAEPVEVPRELPLLLPEILGALSSEQSPVEQAEEVGMPLFTFQAMARTA